MKIDFYQFLNPFDISILIIIILSIFFGIKNGFIKSFFNLIKWILIFYLIKNCFNFLRPIVDQYVSNQTISDILIFIFTLVTTYIAISFINRIIIGILQPKRSAFLDLSFGAIFGIFRGYIIFVLIFFFINSNIPSRSLPNFLDEGSFKDIVNYGVNILDQIPRDLNDIENLNI